MTTIDEQKIAGASYIFSFFREIQTLTHNHASYINLMLELKEKHGEKGEAKFSEGEREQVKQFIQMLRHSATKCYVLYRSIEKGLKLKENMTLKNKYEEIKDEFVIETKGSEEFTIAMNEALMSQVIQNLMQTSSGIVGAVFDGTGPTTG